MVISRLQHQRAFGVSLEPYACLFEPDSSLGHHDHELKVNGMATCVLKSVIYFVRVVMIVATSTFSYAYTSYDRYKMTVS